MSQSAPNKDGMQMAAWYVKGDPDVPANTREVLEKYSKVPSDQVISHVAQIRDKAWAVCQYPCIGTYRFLDLSIDRLPAYGEIIQRMKAGDTTFLDLGCCMGHDIRRLVYDGAPSEGTYGSDLKGDFFPIGYDLFKDHNTLKTEFMAADVFDDDSALKNLNGKIDIIQASAFFHLFELESQQKIARRIVKILKPKNNSMIVGRQIGNLQAGRVEAAAGTWTYRHNQESWKKMWDEVGEENGIHFEVETVMEELNDKLRQDRLGAKWLVYTVRIA